MHFFEDAEVVHAYTRADAIEDGMLVELDSTMVREAGLRLDVAMTSAAHMAAVELTDMARDMGGDVRGRAWDVLNMLRYAASRSRGSELRFRVLVVRNKRQPEIVELKALCGPGDAGEPTITVMLPDED